MIKFILNNTLIETRSSSGMAVLDFVRKEQQLRGSKLVCKEGECGACTVLVGRRKGNKMAYQSMTSCIMPLINANGKHIVTIEGLNMTQLTPVQKAMVNAYGSQCGFCTPGFVVSLTGCLLSNTTFTREAMLESIDGNICRCTGYKSIERAAEAVLKKIKKEVPRGSVNALVKKKYLPEYFKDIVKRLKDIDQPDKKISKGIKVGGGTDLYVQKPYQMYEESVAGVYDHPQLNEIKTENGICTFGASLTMGDLYRSKIFNKAIPDLTYFFKLLSSTQIRNMATIGGNLVNASPIGDFTIFLLALNSTIVLNKNGKRRSLLLRNFYKDYKKMDIRNGEYLEQIWFEIPNKQTTVHFEKVSQRRYLDIASVNFASKILLDVNNTISDIHLAVGGVAAVPLYLKKTIQFLKNKPLEESLIDHAIEVLDKEISPISDARGSTDYKRLLARQLFVAQFLNLDESVFDVKKFIFQ